MDPPQQMTSPQSQRLWSLYGDQFRQRMNAPLYKLFRVSVCYWLRSFLGMCNHLPEEGKEEIRSNITGISKHFCHGSVSDKEAAGLQIKWLLLTKLFVCQNGIKTIQHNFFFFKQLHSTHLGPYQLPKSKHHSVHRGFDLPLIFKAWMTSSKDRNSQVH